MSLHPELELSARDLRIRLKCDTHTYIVDEKEEYRSVSSILSALDEEPFDAEKIAAFMHRSDPSKSIAEHAEAIRAKGEASRDKGKRFHKLIEQIGATEEALDLVPTDLHTLHRQWCVWMCTDRPKMILRSEWMIFSEQHKVAGTVDAIVSVGDELWLVDWKTNKTISKNTLRQYELQLNLYDYILFTEYNVRCHRLVLVQVNDARSKPREIPVRKVPVVHIISGQCKRETEEERVIKMYDV